MGDILDRARFCAEHGSFAALDAEMHVSFRELADEIEALRAEIARLREETLNEAINAVAAAHLPRERLSCSDDESGTQLSLGRQRRWSMKAIAALKGTDR